MDKMPTPDWRSECGRFVMYCGDCLDVLPKLPGGCVDAIICDPPYGINHSSSHGASWMDTKIAGDSDTEARDRALRWRESIPAAVFGTWKTPPIEGTRGALVWDKGPAFGMGDLSFPWKPSWELIYIRGAGWHGSRDEGVLRGDVVVSWESRGRVHPHQKPEWIAESLLAKLPSASTILDPFMGSGTTGVACVKTGRRFIGIELERTYFDIAVKRMEQAIEQHNGGPMFADLKQDEPELFTDD